MKSFRQIVEERLNEAPQPIKLDKENFGNDLHDIAAKVKSDAVNLGANHFHYKNGNSHMMFHTTDGGDIHSISTFRAVKTMGKRILVLISNCLICTITFNLRLVGF